MNDGWTVINIDAGDCVLCDVCNKDYTTSNESGGLIFCSSAVCPECTAQFLADAAAYGELNFIRAQCPEGQSFADFVRQYRKESMHE